MSNLENIKDALYNRQIYVYGKETQQKYSQTSICVLGLSGSGCELCKNLILSGIKKLTICDPRPISWIDLNTMFFATPADVGKPRDDTLCSRLAELNRFVEVSVVSPNLPFNTNSDTIEIDDTQLKSHQIIVTCNLPVTHKSIIDLNRCCRQYGCKFVSVETAGVAGLVFVDGGNNFTIYDTNGEDSRTCVIVGMSDDGMVNLHIDKKHECEAGDEVYFMNLQGVSDELTTPINGTHQPKVFKVKEIIDPYTLKVELPESITKKKFFPRGGYLITTKLPAQLHFASLEASLKEGSQYVEVLDVETKTNDGSDVFSCFQVYHNFLQHYKGSWNHRNLVISDEDLKEAARRLNITTESTVNLLSIIGPIFNGNIPSTSCFFGSVAAQEVLKLSSGKFTPLKQWLCYDFREILTNIPLASTNRETLNCRYDGQLIALGHTIHNYITSMSAFIVGAGALGCELIKNVALMGFGTKGTGKVVITDMDNIEMSNLSRQFLFRTEHIGMSKSVIARDAAKKINPDMLVIAMTHKVSAETEHIFNPEFWQEIDIVCNALDNIPGRRYVDSKCLAYKRPLFESGTLGSKCNVQVVIPCLTTSYSSSYDAPEASIPLCTLKNFPSSIEHTIQWARDNFEQEYTNTPNEFNRYLSSDIVEHQAMLNREPGTMESVITLINTILKDKPRTAESCIIDSRHKFDSLFNHNIQQLLANIPLDRVDENGIPFWSGSKKPPVSLKFDIKNQEHIKFIKAASYLSAKINNISEKEFQKLLGFIFVEASTPASSPSGNASSTTSTAALENILKNIKEFPFIPVTRHYALTEKDDSNDADVASGSGTNNGITQVLPEPTSITDPVLRTPMQVEEFEKDDDSNRHIDYVTVVSNLRAMNYGIPPADRAKTKLISGRIIPAMITTTTFVTGAVIAEVYKYCTHERKITNYRNTFVNLAINMYVVNEPEPCSCTTYVNPETGDKLVFSMWDSIEIDEGRDLTLKELVHLLEEKYKVDIFMISTASGKTLYMNFSAKNKMALPIGAIMIQLEPHNGNLGDVLTLIVTCSFGEQDCDAFPNVTYRFRKFRRVEATS